jgi:putative antitoxin of VapBC-like toxin-antitoxin system
MSRDSKLSVNCYLADTRSLYPGSVITIAKRKTSFEIDTDKVDAARDILGTKTMTETVDAALDEIVDRRRREKLVELIFDSDALAIDDPEAMRGAWRQGGRRWHTS